VEEDITIVSQFDETVSFFFVKLFYFALHYKPIPFFGSLSYTIIIQVANIFAIIIIFRVLKALYLRNTIQSALFFAHFR
jgi:hypothetical protein